MLKIKKVADCQEKKNMDERIIPNNIYNLMF